MKRYIAQFVRGGFPELYVVLDTHEGWHVSQPQPYHEANDEAQARNDGTWGQPQLNPVGDIYANWLGGLTYKP